MRTIGLILGLLVLAGCAPPLGSAALPGLAQFDMATLIASDKTMLDHLVSVSSGKNCSSVRVEKGLYYCEEDEPRGVKQNLFCYRSLGRVTCYDRPDPHRNNHQRVGEHFHPLGIGTLFAEKDMRRQTRQGEHDDGENKQGEPHRQAA